MMLLHHPGTGDVEAFHAMERYVEEGKIRSLGLSNWYREELTEFILTAPLDEVFGQTPVHFEAPPDTFVRRPSRVCPRCGESCSEPYLRIMDGEIVCLDCAEKA